MNDKVLFEIENLQVAFPVEEGTLLAVDGLSLKLRHGEILALVGESGSGKTVAMMSSLGLQAPQAIVRGKIRYRNQEIHNWNNRDWSQIRGRSAGLVLQDPMGSLNPHLCIGEQIWEAPLTHGLIKSKDKVQFAIDALSQVGIPDPHIRWRDYPHQFSGGMCQRVMIASALSCKPDLMILDEPTTALDVTVERQIMQLLSDLRQKYQTAQLLVTHNLRLALHHADTIAVMYGGILLEVGSSYHIMTNPRHPYTRFLLDLASSTPMQRRERGWSSERLAPWNERILLPGEELAPAQSNLIAVEGEIGHWVNHQWLLEKWWDLGNK